MFHVFRVIDNSTSTKNAEEKWDWLHPKICGLVTTVYGMKLDLKGNPFTNKNTEGKQIIPLHMFIWAVLVVVCVLWRNFQF